MIFGESEVEFGIDLLDSIPLAVALGGAASIVGNTVVGVSSGVSGVVNAAFTVNFSVALSQQLSRALKIHRISL